MQMNTQDYMKKALLEYQEQVRDYMFYAETAKTPKVQEFFRDQALSSGEAANALRGFIQENLS